MFELLAKIFLVLTLLAGMIAPRLGAVEEPIFVHIANGVVDCSVVILPSTIAQKGGWYCNGVFKPIEEWKQTSKTETIRKNYAGHGFTYDSVKDAFIAPKPSDDATLNSTTLKWELPATITAISATST